MKRCKKPKKKRRKNNGIYYDIQKATTNMRVSFSRRPGKTKTDFIIFQGQKFAQKNNRTSFEDVSNDG